MQGTLRWRLHVLGLVGLAAHTALVLLSYVQAPALWRPPHAPRAAAFFESMGFNDLPFPGLRALIQDGPSAMTSLAIPLLIASIAAWLAIIFVSRGRFADESRCLRPAIAWSCAFAAVSVFGFPAFTQDFWLSGAWGRMIAAGANPYHTLFTPDNLTGLPLDHFPMPMTYGPLWGLASAGMTLLAGADAWATALAFKLLLGAAWAATFWLVLCITRDYSPAHRLLAVLAVGWIPMAPNQTLLEGHNDIAMVAFAMLWLYLLLRRVGMAPLALAAATLCKFVTAPLFLVDAVHALRHDRVPLGRYLLRLLPAVLLCTGGLALFFRSPRFFDGLKMIGDWHFLRPADALAPLAKLAGLPTSVAEIPGVAIFAAIGLFYLLAAWRRPGREATLRAAIAVLAAFMFGVAAHVWPWYAIWALAPAAILPHWWLARFVIGIAVLLPFTVAFWWVPAWADSKEIGALALYAGAVVWAVATWPGGALAFREAFGAPPDRRAACGSDRAPA